MRFKCFCTQVTAKLQQASSFSMSGFILSATYILFQINLNSSIMRKWGIGNPYFREEDDKAKKISTSLLNQLVSNLANSAL